MAHYQRMGSVPPKRHTQHRRPASRGKQGDLYYEELMGEEGFSSDSSLLYHRNIPSTIADAREWSIGDLSTTPNHPLVPRHLRLHDLFDAAAVRRTDPVTGRRLVLGNGDVRISYAVSALASPWYRNGIGDECVFVERGRARVESVFGAFDVGPGDYVDDPPGDHPPVAATTLAARPAADVCDRGQLPHRAAEAVPVEVRPAPRALAVLRAGPTAPLPGRLLAEDVGARAGDETEVFIKHRGSGPGGVVGTVHTLPFHPLDVVGWDGCLYPYVFNVARLRANHGTRPPAATGAPGVRGLELRDLQLRAAEGRLPPAVDPGAVLPLQRRQRRDHVLRRRGLRGAQGVRESGAGSISVHPGGHPHGPQPGATEGSIGVHYFDELAVMVDTFRPLELGEGGRAVDDGRYALSWLRGSGPGAARPTEPPTHG